MVRSTLSVALLGALAFLLHCGSDAALGDDDGDDDAAVQGDDDDDTPQTKDDGGPTKQPGKDASSDGATSSSSSSSGGGGDFTDYSVKGPRETAHESSTTGNEDCDEDVVRYHPAAGAASATILIEHGFLGNVGDLADIGEHLASWGFDVIAVTACTNSDHAANGAAMSALADKLAIPAPYFSGFSAGGLAGFLAAKQNTHTAGYVGLDPVDADDLGKDAAPLSVPVRAVLTEISDCNATGNFTDVLLKQANAKAVRIVGASHFDITSVCPALSACSFSGCTPTTPERHATILAFATAALLEITGTDATAGGYFTPGSPAYDAHVADGTIEAP